MELEVQIQAGAALCEVQISLEARYFVNLEVQISWEAHLNFFCHHHHQLHHRVAAVYHHRRRHQQQQQAIV